MTKKIQVVLGMALLMMLVVTQKSFADLTWDWGFVQPDMVVSPDQTAVLNAWITNSPSSTTNITYSLLHCAIDNGGTSNNFYTFSFGPNGDGDFYSQFGNLNLAPGQTLDFVFGTETPTNPPVPAGTVVSDTAELSLLNCNGTDNCITQPYQITVEAPSGPGVVPEPATILLLGLGIVGAGITLPFRRLT